MRKIVTAGVAGALFASALTAGYVSASPPDQSSTPYQVVAHDNEKSWKIDVFNGTVTFEPATGCDMPAVRGAGAVHLQVDPGDGWARERNDLFHNTPLASLDALDYWACDNNNNGQQWPFLMLNIDWDGDQQPDDIIFFEPAYQNPTQGGACGLITAQDDPVLHEWQQWDALDGTNGTDANACWWSLNDPTFMPGFAIRSLKEYVLEHPEAAIVNPSGNFGGVQVVHGFASPSDVFDGYVDNLRIGDMNVNRAVTYDFEPAHS